MTGEPALSAPLPVATSGGTAISLLGVDYIRLKAGDGGDLYLTRFGALFRRHLLLENWFAPDWFESRRERLLGTGTVYKVPTRLVRGLSLNLVVKWSRVGEQVPLDTLTVNKFIHAEFNSPFEEFALLMELRKGENGPPGIRIRKSCNTTIASVQSPAISTSTRAGKAKPPEMSIAPPPARAGSHRIAIVSVTLAANICRPTMGRDASKLVACPR